MINEDQIQKILEDAALRAAEYVKRNFRTPKLPDTGVPFPNYSASAVQQVLRTIINEATSEAVAAPRNERRKIIVIGGPGAKATVKQQLGEKLADLSVGAIKVDFAVMKAALRRALPDEDIDTNYAQWRPLLAGLDQSLHEFAKKNHFSIVADNQLAPPHEKGEEHTKELLGLKDPAVETHLFVAHVPLEKILETPGMTREEAEKNKPRFKEFFSSIKGLATSFIELDANGKIADIKEPTAGRAY